MLKFTMLNLFLKLDLKDDVNELERLIFLDKNFHITQLLY